MSNETIFSKIIRREIPADIVFESENVLAFRDINPIAPTHILVIPKRFLASLADAAQEDAELLGELFLAATKIAKEKGLDDYRVVVNTGSGAGQSVFHLHLHLIGGRRLSWPPG